MTIKEICEVTIVHEEVVERVQQALPDVGAAGQNIQGACG